MSCRASPATALIDAGAGVFASVSLFENAKEAHESTRIAARWVREEKLEAALPNTPKITTGPVAVHQARPLRQPSRTAFQRSSSAATTQTTERPDRPSSFREVP